MVYTLTAKSFRQETVLSTHDYVVTRSDVPLKDTVSSATEQKTSAIVTPTPKRTRKRYDLCDEDKNYCRKICHLFWLRFGFLQLGVQVFQGFTH